ARGRNRHARAGLERAAVDGILGRGRTGAGVGGAERDRDVRGLPARGRIVGGRRRRVVDPARDDVRGGAVAGDVDGDRPQVVDAVRDRGRVPVLGRVLPVVGARERVLVGDGG